MGTKRLFGTNGIRGIVNDTLTPEFMIKIGMAAASTKAVAPKQAYNGELDRGRRWRIP